MEGLLAEPFSKDLSNFFNILCMLISDMAFSNTVNVFSAAMGVQMRRCIKPRAKADQFSAFRNGLILLICSLLKLVFNKKLQI